MKIGRMFAQIQFYNLFWWDFFRESLTSFFRENLMMGSKYKELFLSCLALIGNFPGHDLDWFLENSSKKEHLVEKSYSKNSGVWQWPIDIEIWTSFVTPYIESSNRPPTTMAVFLVDGPLWTRFTKWTFLPLIIIDKGSLCWCVNIY